uniref:Probable RNA polymerase II nuclear localization protein SLC7A6OS n=1 Tax=Hirondellea gigas TaxID=1518452 RepID=A0A2P2I0V2_9CRUS
MELAIIRIKRPRESEPLEEITLASKRFKLESYSKLQSVATLQSKDEPLDKVLKDVVSKLRRQKVERHNQRAGLAYSQLYKHRAPKGKPSAVQKGQAASQSRYQITNKARGLVTQLDPDTEKYLSTSEQFALLTDGESKDFKTSASVSDDASAAGGAAAAGLGIQVVDVDHHSVKNVSAKQDDVICMNGVPLEQTFVYDIFITRVPKGYSIDELKITDVANELDDEYYSESEGEKSDDSNAESNYRNDYPDEESDDETRFRGGAADYDFQDDFSYLARDDYWDDPLVDMMRTTELGDGSKEEEPSTEVLEDPVPQHIRGLVNFRPFNKLLTEGTPRHHGHDSDSDDDDEN